MQKIFKEVITSKNHPNVSKSTKILQGLPCMDEAIGCSENL